MKYFNQTVFPLGKLINSGKNILVLRNFATLLCFVSDTQSEMTQYRKMGIKPCDGYTNND